MSSPAVTPQFSVQSFAQSVRTKYPGAYDHLSDEDLTQKVVAKYPQYGSQIANYGLSSPSKAPIPAALQQNPRLSDLIRQGAGPEALESNYQPYVQSAEAVGSMGAGPGTLAQMVGDAGKAAGFAEKFLPWSKLSRSGEAIEGLSRSVARTVGKNAPQLPEVPLREQMAQQALQGQRVAQRFGNPTSGRSTGGRPPRPDLIEQMGGKPIEDVANSDAAVKERMEQSPEVTYGKYAKAHQGKGSRTYPEPDYFQEQGPNRAPWGGNFPHQ